MSKAKCYMLGKLAITICTQGTRFRYLVKGEGYNSWEKDPGDVAFIIETLGPVLAARRPETPPEPDGIGCSICHRLNPDGKALRPGVEIDGEARGLLCNPCKGALAQLGNDPSRLLAAVRYLSAPEDMGVADADLVQG